MVIWRQSMFCEYLTFFVSCKYCFSFRNSLHAIFFSVGHFPNWPLVFQTRLPWGRMLRRSWTDWPGIVSWGVTPRNWQPFLGMEPDHNIIAEIRRNPYQVLKEPAGARHRTTTARTVDAPRNIAPWYRPKNPAGPAPAGCDTLTTKPGPAYIWLWNNNYL